MELMNNGMIQTDETDEYCHHRHPEKIKLPPGEVRHREDLSGFK